MKNNINTTSQHIPKNDSPSIIGRKNRYILIVACLLIIGGFLLMSGEESTSEAFCPDIFSARRIVIAPAVCLAGYLLVIVGIMWRR